MLFMLKCVCNNNGSNTNDDDYDDIIIYYNGKPFEIRLLSLKNGFQQGSLKILVKLDEIKL